MFSLQSAVGVGRLLHVLFAVPAMDRLIKIKLAAQITCLGLLAYLLLHLLFSSVPLLDQSLLNLSRAGFQSEQLLCQLQTQVIQPLSPHLLQTAQNIEQVSNQLAPKTAVISANLMEMSLRGRRIAIAEEEVWNSPAKVRQRNEWMNGVSEMLANINRLLPVVDATARDTRFQLQAGFQQLNQQILPEFSQNLQQVNVVLVNLSTLSQTLNLNSDALLREATLATQQLTGAGQLIQTVLHDPRSAQVLRDLARISANGVTVSEQMAVMSVYGAETAKTAPELARRFNEIVKGAQGWQKVFNLTRLIGTVLGFFW